MSIISFVSMSSNADDAEVFVYTGEVGASIPHDVVRVRVDPSVTSILYEAFRGRRKLAEVELCEGLVEIGSGSLAYCNHSITIINIPTSLRRIKNYAFRHSLRTPIRLHDDIESIGEGAFAGCIFTNFRVPPLITVIPEEMLYYCNATFSLELPDNMREIERYAFCYCYCLRNVAFPPNAVFDDDIFIDNDDEIDNRTDLQLLFGSDAEIIHELQHRFDELPIHSIVYYQTYYHGVLQILIAAINTRSDQHHSLHSQLNLTGNQQDCLGMTPLHILTCSSVHNLEVYRLLVENYPTNLITEDRWGALPLLYAFWGAAPAEIIQFLLESYQALYPGYEFRWTNMVETMGRTDTPKERIENLLRVKQMLFPEQPLDWEYLLNNFMRPSKVCFQSFFTERMQFLVTCGMSMRVEALAFKVWRSYITNMIQTSIFEYGVDNMGIMHGIREKLVHFEDELPKLKEISTILELALWKSRLNERNFDEEATRCKKKVKTDKSSIRRQCRITCGADSVIGHVLMFLVTA
jgi:hypothetical protein